MITTLILPPLGNIGIVYAGRAVLRIGEEERTVQQGDFYCLPVNVQRSDTSLVDAPFVMLDIFFPVREDLIEKLKTVPVVRKTRVG